VLGGKTEEYLSIPAGENSGVKEKDAETEVIL